MLTRLSAARRRSIGFGVVVAAAGLMLTTAGYRSAEVGHPPERIESMGHSYRCDASAPLTKAAAQSREHGEGKLHLVGWVPVTHGVFAVHRADSDVFVQFGHRYFPCQVAHTALGHS